MVVARGKQTFVVVAVGLEKRFRLGDGVSRRAGGGGGVWSSPVHLSSHPILRCTREVSASSLPLTTDA